MSTLFGVVTINFFEAKNVHHVVFKVNNGYTQKSKVYGYRDAMYPSGHKTLFKVYHAEEKRMVWVGDSQAWISEVVD